MTDSDLKQTITLLQEWVGYNAIAHTRQATFHDAIDIEVERTYLSMLAGVLLKDITSETTSPETLEVIAEFSTHLEKFKGLLTMEVLRNGLDDKK